MHAAPAQRPRGLLRRRAIARRRQAHRARMPGARALTNMATASTQQNPPRAVTRRSVPCRMPFRGSCGEYAAASTGAPAVAAARALRVCSCAPGLVFSSRCAASAAGSGHGLRLSVRVQGEDGLWRGKEEEWSGASGGAWPLPPPAVHDGAAFARDLGQSECVRARAWVGVCVCFPLDGTERGGRVRV